MNTGITGTNFSLGMVVLLHFLCVYALLHRQLLCDRPISSKGVVPDIYKQVSERKLEALDYTALSCHTR
ncbi:hypothetical protein B7P43_G01453 [Cryptotermes secundus]|uniref:Uncharacterized protein n=1 Tax=Cryptotermes secundus TaxID=105785 RepID=A0A2J7RK43_9NEOP|nr:hypothetical protein B7P43_G01453 [Cryptotermes secundus]